MFADRLKQARKFKHYSQAELSRLLGVTQQAVGKWETGRSTPDPKTVARLAELLDTRPMPCWGCAKQLKNQTFQLRQWDVMPLPLTKNA